MKPVGIIFELTLPLQGLAKRLGGVVHEMRRERLYEPWVPAGLGHRIISRWAMPVEETMRRRSRKRFWRPGS